MWGFSPCASFRAKAMPESVLQLCSVTQAGRRIGSLNSATSFDAIRCEPRMQLRRCACQRPQPMGNGALEPEQARSQVADVDQVVIARNNGVAPADIGIRMPARGLHRRRCFVSGVPCAHSLRLRCLRPARRRARKVLVSDQTSVPPTLAVVVRSNSWPRSVSRCAGSEQSTLSGFIMGDRPPADDLVAHVHEPEQPDWKRIGR